MLVAHSSNQVRAFAFSRLQSTLHMHVALDMNRLVFIELGFHMTLLACGLTLTLGLMRIAGSGAAGPSNLI